MTKSTRSSSSKSGPRVLTLDIETAPILGYVWSLWDQNVALNQIESDWYVLAWAAKWLGDAPGKVMYADQRSARDIEDDKKILQKIWKLLDEADIVITQNGKKFDEKKLNARFILNGMKPPSPYQHIDTCQIAKARFGFTSNKLEYLTSKLNTKYRKLDHAKFAGFKLWRECLAGNPEAWREMEKYNRHDVLSTEELYLNLQPWASAANQINYNLYTDDITDICSCGKSGEWDRNGYRVTRSGKFQRYKCKNCGTHAQGKTNLFSKDKRKSLRS